MVVGTSLSGATSSSLALNGSAVGNPETSIAFGTTYTSPVGDLYTFNSSGGTLQLVVQGGSQSLSFADAIGLWNTDPSNKDWKTSNDVLAAFRNGDLANFVNGATVTVDSGGIQPSQLNFSNPSPTAVQVSGGSITTDLVTANGSGSVNVQSDLNSRQGITDCP